MDVRTSGGGIELWRIKLTVEQEFIASIIQNPDLMMQTAIKPEDLHDRDMRGIYAAIVNLVSRGVNIDLATVASEYGDISTVAKYSVPSSLNFKYFEVKLCEEIQLRRLNMVKNTLSDMLATGAASSSITERIGELLAEAPVSDSVAQIKSLHECALEFGPELERLYALKGKLPGIPTGIPRLDQSIGGWQTGTHYIGARPGDGKTAFLLTSMMAAVKSGAKAALISIESSTGKLISRVLAAEGPILAEGLRKGSLTASEFGRLGDTIRRFEGYNGYIYSNVKTDRVILEGVARRLIKTMGVEVLFIDYLQRIKGKGFNRTEKVESASRLVTEIAEGYEIPVVCLAQTGRIADKEEPSLGHFQHASAIEQDGDTCMILRHEKDEAEMDPTEVSYGYLLKNREGPLDRIPIYFDRKHVRFMAMEEG